MAARHAFGLLIGLGIAACGDGTVDSANTRAKLTEATPVRIDGIGPIEIGMTRAEADHAADIHIVVPDDTEGCRYGSPQAGPAGLSFMLTDDIVVRIDISDNVRITTAAGAHIGSSEADIERLYAPRLTVTPHKYQDGHFLTVTDPNYPHFRYVFETNGKTVSPYRVGQLPEVEFVERCG